MFILALRQYRLSYTAALYRASAKITSRDPWLGEEAKKPGAVAGRGCDVVRDGQVYGVELLLGAGQIFRVGNLLGMSGYASRPCLIISTAKRFSSASFLSFSSCSSTLFIAFSVASS